MHDAVQYDDARRADETVADARSAHRYTLLIRAAKLITAKGEYLCVIRDASEGGLSARVFQPLAPETALTIELQNGDRHVAEVVWQQQDRAGFRFTAAADVRRIIESPSDYAKRAIRLNFAAEAELCTGGRTHDVTITNISQQGASIICTAFCAIDQHVTLRVGRLYDAEAKVRWRSGRRLGLVFENTMRFEQLARIANWLQRHN